MFSWLIFILLPLQSCSCHSVCIVLSWITNCLSALRWLCYSFSCVYYRMCAAIQAGYWGCICQKFYILIVKDVCSSRSGVQPTLDPSAETFISVQCASPGRGGELVGVCGVCASCVGWRKGWVGVSSLSGISKHAPLGVAYCLPKPGLALIQCQPWPALLQRLAMWLTLLQRLARAVNHICLLRLSRQRGWHLDTANQGISNGHNL